MVYCLYILGCKDKFIYTGITWNLQKRLEEHEKGNVPFTKVRLPVKLLYTETFTSRISAARKEKEIKGWNRNKKLRYISNLS